MAKLPSRLPGLARWTVAAAFALAPAGCWGSASESPWPAEPADVDLGPAGEEELRNPGKNAPGTTTAPAPTTSAARPKSDRQTPSTDPTTP